MENLFVVTVRYLVPIEQIDAHLDAHIVFLEGNFTAGNFIVSGPQIPRNGGIIIAKTKDRKILEGVLKDDPFAIHSLAEYQIFEFNPVRHLSCFSQAFST